MLTIAYKHSASVLLARVDDSSGRIDLRHPLTQWVAVDGRLDRSAMVFVIVRFDLTSASPLPCDERKQ